MAKTSQRRIWATTLLTLLCTACATPSIDQKNASVSDKRVLRTNMHELWFHLIELDYALLEPTRRQDVADALSELRRIADDIDDDTVREVHPWLPAERRRFITTIEQARRSAATDPPDYAGTMVVFDSCTRCHAIRDGLSN